MSDMDAVAIIGGTGKLGSAMARRLAKAGQRVIIGSRSAERAQQSARELGLGVVGATNAAAAAESELVIVTVPFASQLSTLTEIQPHVGGKIVVDATVPLVPPRVAAVQLPPEGSAAARAQRVLGERAIVISAFHNVAAHKLASEEPIECDVLVFGDVKAARTRVVGLAKQMGLRGLHGGALANSVAAEALTSILIFLNKTYQVDGAGIQITGDLIEA